MLSQGLGLLAQPITALANGFDNFVTNVGNFFGNLTDSLSNWFTDVIADLQEMSSNIGNWFAGIGDKIQGFAEDVSGFFNGLTQTIVDWFTDLIDDLQELSLNIGNWFSELSDNIAGFFEDLGDKITVIMSYLNPFSDNFFLKIAFIPSQEFIEMNNERMALLGEQKFGFVEDFKSVFQELKDNLNNDTNAPNFTLSLPSKWGGGTVNIINFEAYDSIRLLIKNIIRVFIWLYFIFKMYKRIPKIIY